MIVYKIFDDVKNYQSFHLDNEDFLDLLDESIGEAAAMQFSQQNIALQSHWKPLKITFRQNDESKNKVPDIGLWRNASMILSPKATEVLRPMLVKLGELLPLDFEGKEYSLFNCMTEVAADESLSVKVEEDGFFMDVEKLAFSSILSTPIFKSPFENSRNLFCTESFKAAIEGAGLSGIYLSEDLVGFM